jgi:hypothetical protein
MRCPGRNRSSCSANTARRVAQAAKGNGRSAGADRPFVLLAFQVSAYWTLNWALVPGVEPQSYSCRSAPLAVVLPVTFRQRPEATFLNA